MIPGLNVTQSGPKGQQTSIFARGTNSNHTLVLLNGIPINDQSTTQGLHDFGVDFVQTIHQVEVYIGPNGAHFGPSAIGGAVNFITAGDFKNSFEISGKNNKNKTVSGNYTKITNDDFSVGKHGVQRASGVKKLRNRRGTEIHRYTQWKQHTNITDRVDPNFNSN